MSIDLVPGTVVRQYRVVRLIAHGGIASTYEAEDVRGGARFAMKRLSLGELRDWKTYELFEREARVLSGLRHPSIPRYVEHFEHELPPGQHAYYLVQELAPGASLADRVAKGWRCDEAEVRRIAVQLLGILRDLQALTPPVFHRDVKPHNVLRSDDGRLFLVDFGAVRDAYRTLTGGSTVVGTYGYMAPEQLRGVALPATDVYGVASMVLFLLTGTAPNDLPQRGLRPDFRPHARCSPSLAAWLDRALEPEPEKRFASARDAYDALRGVPQAEKKRSTMRVAALASVLVALAVPTAFFVRSVKTETAVATAKTRANGGAAALPPRPTSSRYHIASKALVAIEAHHNGALSVDVSPDGRTIASGGGDGSLRLSDAKTGAAIATFAGLSDRVFSLHFTRDGHRLVSAAGKRVDVWDVATHTSALRFEGDTQEVVGARPSPDDRWLATTGSADRAVKIWDLATGRPIRTLAPVPSAIAPAIAFTPDGKVVAAAGEDTMIRMWNVETGTLLVTCAGHSRTVDDLAFSPDGVTLYSTSDDHTMRVWRAADCQPRAALGDHRDEVWAVAANGRGDLVATGTKDGSIKIWDAGSMLLKYQFSDLGKGTTRLAFMPDGSGLAASQASGRVNVWALPEPSHVVFPASPVIRDPPEVTEASSPAELCARAFALIDAANGRDTLTEAEALTRKALAKSPGFAPANCALAIITIRHGYLVDSDYRPEAIQQAKQLIALAEAKDPKLPEIHIARSWVFHAGKDREGAAREGALAEANGPTAAGDTVLATENSKLRGTTADVERYALRALSEKPTRGEAWFIYQALALSYVDVGDYDAADRAYRAQIDVDPDAVWAKGNYAHFLVDIGKYPEAEAAAKRALTQMDYGSARQALSKAHSEAGIILLWDFAHAESARTEFEAAIAADPSNATAHYGLGAYWKVTAAATGNSGAAASAKSETEKYNALAKP